jgi:hypothetical protein
MKRSNFVVIAIPFIIVLAGLSFYQYGYLRIRSELASLKEMQGLKTKTLEKYITLISEKPALEKELAALKEIRKAENSNIIEGQTPSIAAASLQNSIVSIITGKGGTISSERVGKPEDLGSFTMIDVVVDAIVPDSRALTDILYSLETRTPYLVMKEVDGRVRNFRDPRELMVKLDISALTSGR